MRWFSVVLIGLFAFLQYQLWFATGGILSVRTLQQHIQNQKAENQRLVQRNKVLIADVRDLKSGNHAIEARAREDLGMIKQGEVFYQVVK